MTETNELATSDNDVTVLKIAREIAMDIHPLENILKRHGVSQAAWESIQNNPRFTQYLRGAVAEWESAINTAERVRIKSLAFVEESLPEFFARAHDQKENLSAKTEILKTVAKFAGVGGTVDGNISGEKLVVTINLGEDRKLRIERDVTPQVTEGEAE